MKITSQYTFYDTQELIHQLTFVQKDAGRNQIVYVTDAQGTHLDHAELVEEILSDSSTVYSLRLCQNRNNLPAR